MQSPRDSPKPVGTRREGGQVNPVLYPSWPSERQSRPHSPLVQVCSIGIEGAGALEPSEWSPHDLPQ